MARLRPLGFLREGSGVRGANLLSLVARDRIWGKWNEAAVQTGL